MNWEPLRTSHIPAGPVFLFLALVLLGTAWQLLDTRSDSSPVRPVDAVSNAMPEDLSAAIGPGRATRIGKVVPDLARSCLPAGKRYYDTAARAGLSRLSGILQLSDLGQALLRQAGLRNVLLCLDGATDLNGYYRSQMRVIGINADLSDARKVVFLAHELVHVTQHPHYSNNRYFPAKDLVLLRRVREAAAEALATRVLWQLRHKGYPQAWREKLATRYGDIALAFQVTWQARPHSSVRAHSATRAAFDRWFAVPWRLNFYDHLSLRHLERIAADPMGLVPARRALTSEFLAAIAWLDGENFLMNSETAALTGGAYRTPLSERNEARYQDLMRRGRRTGSRSYFER